MIALGQPDPKSMKDIEEILKEGDSRLETTRVFFPGYGIPCPGPDEFYERAFELIRQEGKGRPEAEHRAHQGLGIFYAHVGSRFLFSAPRENADEVRLDYYQKALFHLLSAYRINPDPKTKFNLAQVALLTGQYLSRTFEVGSREYSHLKELLDSSLKQMEKSAGEGARNTGTDTLKQRKKSLVSRLFGRTNC